MNHPDENKEATARCPETVKPEHIGTSILYKLPNQAVISEGQIEAISPDGKYFRVGPKRWLANQAGSVLSILKPNQKPTRRGIRTR